MTRRKAFATVAGAAALSAVPANANSIINTAALAEIVKDGQPITPMMAGFLRMGLDLITERASARGLDLQPAIDRAIAAFLRELPPPLADATRDGLSGEWNRKTEAARVDCSQQDEAREQRETAAYQRAIAEWERSEPTDEQVADMFAWLVDQARQDTASFVETARQLYRFRPDWITAVEYPAELLSHLRALSKDPEYVPCTDWDRADAFASEPTAEMLEYARELAKRRSKPKPPTSWRAANA